MASYLQEETSVISSFAQHSPRCVSGSCSPVVLLTMLDCNSSLVEARLSTGLSQVWTCGSMSLALGHIFGSTVRLQGLRERDACSWTPLHAASAEGQKPVVEWLLEQGRTILHLRYVAKHLT